jgi:cytochrome o ubiquinol oxidase subunit 3
MTALQARAAVGGESRAGGRVRAGRNAPGTAGQDAAKRIIVGYGFWIFLLSDIIVFSAFFATHAVLATATAGGPTGHDLFNIGNVAIETGCLLLSSFTCGIASIGARARDGRIYFAGMALTLLLGGAFLALESADFAIMVAHGAGPTRSAFLSSFFALVGCHGLHVTLGLLWLLTMMAQVAAKGFRADIMRRQLCFSLFWHTLDIVWVALFSVVYLIGVMP